MGARGAGKEQNMKTVLQYGCGLLMLAGLLIAGAACDTMGQPTTTLTDWQLFGVGLAGCLIMFIGAAGWHITDR